MTEQTTTVPVGAADIGVTGLAVMGANLARNFARHGYTVALHNRSRARTDQLVAEHGDEGAFVATETLAELVQSLAVPRRVLIMVKAGAPVDAVIDQLVPLLDEGDIVIDAGNSHYEDTRRREAALAEKGLHFVGVGVSGGEEGALHGPAIMPGGPEKSYEALGPMLEKISAQFEGEPCCAWVGTDGAGHYVKMVHNGIEYGLMHAYAEGYELLAKKDIVTDVPGAFKAWSRGTVVRSWLLDLMVAALEADPTLEDVSDYTADSGEGRWTVEEAIELAVPMPVISASLFARFASRQQSSPAMQAVAALRGQFGGHQVMTVAEGQELRAEATKGVTSPTASREQEAKKITGSTDASSVQAEGARAASAGPSSGSGSTGESSGPTSGTGSTG